MQWLPFTLTCRLGCPAVMGVLTPQNMADELEGADAPSLQDAFAKFRRGRRKTSVARAEAVEGAAQAAGAAQARARQVRLVGVAGHGRDVDRGRREHLDAEPVWNSTTGLGGPDQT